MVKILDEVIKYLPKDAEIADSVFEGSNIVLYTKNKDFFLDNKGIIKEIVDNIKKRVELRADPSIILDSEKTIEYIQKILPKEAGKPNIILDSQRSRVIIESEKPGLAIGRGGELLKEIKKETLWTPIVRRIPPMRSQLIENIRQVLYDNSDYRRKFLHKVGKRIYDGWTATRRDEWIRLTALGSAREVGRSCFLLQTPESKVLLDCGFNVAAPREQAFPYLDAPELNIQELDAVILSHPHIDHCLPPDTLVELENGNLKQIDRINEGDTLTTFNLATGKKEKGKCLKRVKTYTHKEIIKVKTPYSNIESSPNHKFFVVDNLEVKEMEAKDLREGMIIPCFNENFDINLNSIPLFIDVDYRERLELPKDAKSYLKELRQDRNLTQEHLCKALNKNRNFVNKLENKSQYIYKNTLKEILKYYHLNEAEFYSRFNIQKTNLPHNLNFELSQFIGYITGDGHKSTENSIRITDSSKETLNEYSKLTNKIFNYNPQVLHHYDSTKKAYVAELCNAGILNYIEKNFPKILNDSPHRDIPEFFMLTGNENIKGFIRGFADAEGCVKESQICIDSTSKRLAEQVQFMLNRIGIKATLSKGRNKTGYKNSNISYRINIRAVDSIKKYSELIGFNHPEKTLKLGQLLEKISCICYKDTRLLPLNNIQLNFLIKDMGLATNSTLFKIKDMPKNLKSLYDGYTNYLTYECADSLEKFLHNRLEILNKAINTNIKNKRLTCGLSKMKLAKLVNTSIHNLTILEKEKNNKLYYKVNNKLNEFIFSLLNKTKSNLAKLRLFKNSDLEFQQITKIEKYENKHEYLVDLKISNNSNFVANGIVVHNCGSLPYLYKMGFRGPTYMTAPSRDVASLLCLDMAGIAMKEGNEPIYDSGDVKEMVKHTICLDYEEVSDITPDIRITFYNAGHNLGSSLVHMHIGNGLHNFVYSGDFNYETSNLLPAAATRFPRLESVMMESTYGTRTDDTPTRKESEEQLIGIIKDIAEKKGKVLMPVLGVGRSQECMLILERAMREKKIPEMPIYVQGMVWDVNAIHTAYPDFLNTGVKKAIFQRDHNPFLSTIFKKVVSQKEMTDLKEGKGPFIIMATSGMLQGGPSLEYFKAFAENPKNALVMTCYQGVGSVGRRLEEGDKQINFVSGGSRRQETIEVKMPIWNLRGFSGHSSFKQLCSWVGNLEPRPKKVIIVHGDYSRCIEMASTIYQQYRMETVAPKNLETIRLR